MSAELSEIWQKNLNQICHYVIDVIICRCGVCGNGFKSVGALGQHKRLVHKIVGPRATRDPHEKRVRKKK